MAIPSIHEQAPHKGNIKITTVQNWQFIMRLFVYTPWTFTYSFDITTDNYENKKNAGHQTIAIFSFFFKLSRFSSEKKVLFCIVSTGLEIIIFKSKLKYITG